MGGKVAGVPGAAPLRADLKSQSKVPGAKRVKIRHGPYKVPNMNKVGLSGEAGSLWNYPDTSVTKPCTGECTIVSQQAGLEYPDGTVAHIDTVSRHALGAQDFLLISLSGNVAPSYGTLHDWPRPLGPNLLWKRVSSSC